MTLFRNNKESQLVTCAAMWAMYTSTKTEKRKFLFGAIDKDFPRCFHRAGELPILASLL